MGRAESKTHQRTLPIPLIDKLYWNSPHEPPWQHDGNEKWN